MRQATRFAVLLAVAVLLSAFAADACTCSITGEAGTFTADTDLQGRFEFPVVAPGRYRLSVRLPSNFAPLPPADLSVPGPAACVVHAIMAASLQKTPDTSGEARRPNARALFSRSAFQGLATLQD